MENTYGSREKMVEELEAARLLLAKASYHILNASYEAGKVDQYVAIAGGEEPFVEHVINTIDRKIGILYQDVQFLVTTHKGAA